MWVKQCHKPSPTLPRHRLPPLSPLKRSKRSRSCSTAPPPAPRFLEFIYQHSQEYFMHIPILLNIYIYYIVLIQFIMVIESQSNSNALYLSSYYMEYCCFNEKQSSHLPIYCEDSHIVMENPRYLPENISLLAGKFGCMNF